MTAWTTTPPLTRSARLWTPWQSRLATTLAARWRHLQQRLAERAEQHKARREAAQERTALAGLDARTLRDLGFGDWAAARPETGNADLRRALEPRGW